MTHQLRAQTSIATERQGGWRREAAADRIAHAKAAETPITAGTGFHLAFVGRLSISELRRRIAGVAAEA
jgi:hypothetical protein